MSNPLHFDLIKQTKIIDKPWLKVSSNDYTLPDGSLLEDYYVVEEKQGVTIVALTPEHQVVIVEQFRPPVEAITFDLPGGLLEQGDTDPLVRAKHELQEETGYVSDTWVDLGYFYPAPHRLHNTQRCFAALDVRKATAQKLDATEFVNFKIISIQKLEKMIERNEFLCGYCITAYFKAKLKLNL